MAKRFDAYRWQTIKVEDGSDPDAIEKAILAAKAETKKPSIIMLKTHIAHGSPNKQDTADAHGRPAGGRRDQTDQGGTGLEGEKAFYRSRESPHRFS